MARLREPEKEEDILETVWIKALLRHGKLTILDRATLAETIEQILIFEDEKIEITYLFSDDSGVLEAKEEDVVRRLPLLH